MPQPADMTRANGPPLLLLLLLWRDVRQQRHLGPRIPPVPPHGGQHPRLQVAHGEDAADGGFVALRGGRSKIQGEVI